MARSQRIEYPRQRRPIASASRVFFTAFCLPNRFGKRPTTYHVHLLLLCLPGVSSAAFVAAGADQTVAALGAAAKLPYVDLTRGIVLGVSVSGMTSMALATRSLPGIVAAVNFASGGRGNPIERPKDPCSAFRLTALYKEYGGQAKVLSLWLYSENDRFWGAKLPKEWFNAFIAAGGKAEFVSLQAYKNDRHAIFTRNPAAWRPAFEAFIHQHGF